MGPGGSPRSLGTYPEGERTQSLPTVMCWLPRPKQPDLQSQLSPQKLWATQTHSLEKSVTSGIGHSHRR